VSAQAELLKFRSSEVVRSSGVVCGLLVYKKRKKTERTGIRNEVK
jgi:hypothetical protein